MQLKFPDFKNAITLEQITLNFQPYDYANNGVPEVYQDDRRMLEEHNDIKKWFGPGWHLTH